MQNQRVRLNHIHGAAALVHGIAIVELHGPQVGKQQEVGRHLAHAKGLARFAAFDAGTLAADAHRQPLLLRRFGQVAVDQPRLLGAAGHGTDQDRRVEPLAEYGHARWLTSGRSSSGSAWWTKR